MEATLRAKIILLLSGEPMLLGELAGVFEAYDKTAISMELYEMKDEGVIELCFDVQSGKVGWRLTHGQ